MKIAFATTQSGSGSTLIGRILPLAQLLAQRHQVYVLALREANQLTPKLPGVKIHIVGDLPFIRSAHGKKRMHGWRLAANLLQAALGTMSALWRVSPDVVVIAKALPQNVAGVRWWRIFHPRQRVVLDVDDFEVMAMVTTSMAQRAVLHWVERRAASSAQAIVAATPFLTDHFQQLTSNRKQVTMIPTGIRREHTHLTQTAPRTPTLLYIGSVSVASGHRVDLLPEILAEVRREYPASMLVMAGHGDDEQYLKDLFAQKGLSAAVTWHGAFTLTDIPRLLEGVTLLVDPIDASITQRAKSSFRTILAAANGLPVVSSNVGIRPYLLPQPLHTRLFAQPAEPADYATRIVELLRTPLETRDCQLLISHAEKYTWENLVNQYEKLLI